MHILLSCVGTMGDLMPVLAVGRLMHGRGHTVEILANDVFQTTIEQSGIAFTSLGSQPEFDAFVAGSAWQDNKAGWAAFLREGILPCLAPAAARLAELADYGTSCVILPNNYSYGAKWAARALHLPLINLCIQPGMLRGLHPDRKCEIDLLPGEKTSYWKAMRAAENYLFHTFGKTGAGPTQGLNHLFEGTSPNLPDEHFLALFPEWYEAPSADWPGHLHQTGFPLIDSSVTAPLDPDITDFLAAGKPPVGLFCGSFMRDAARFFETGLKACRENGQRSLLICRYPEDLPKDIPEDCLIVPAAPFGQLFPKLTALIHHGGIGTIAQAMAAGLPQLVFPLRFEQPDNAHAMVQLGAGKVLPLDQQEQADICLKEILTRQEIRENCARLKMQMATQNGFEKCAEVIEESGGKQPGRE